MEVRKVEIMRSDCGIGLDYKPDQIPPLFVLIDAVTDLVCAALILGRRSKKAVPAAFSSFLDRSRSKQILDAGRNTRSDTLVRLDSLMVKVLSLSPEGLSVC